MITYAINCPVGRLFSGIPSYDVAVAMAVDFSRYEMDEFDADQDLVRHEVLVELAEELGIEYTWVYRADGHDRGLGVSAEGRCESCRRTM